MNRRTLVAWLFAAFLTAGCAERDFQTTFYYSRALVEESRDGKDPGVETTNDVITSPKFWERYVAPRLKGPLAHEEKIRSSLRLSLAPGRDGVLSEVTLSLRGGSSAELESVAVAVIEGIDQWMSATDRGKHSPYVRIPKKE